MRCASRRSGGDGEERQRGLDDDRDHARRFDDPESGIEIAFGDQQHLDDDDAEQHQRRTRAVGPDGGDDRLDGALLPRGDPTGRLMVRRPSNGPGGPGSPAVNRWLWAADHIVGIDRHRATFRNSSPYR